MRLHAPPLRFLVIAAAAAVAVVAAFEIAIDVTDSVRLRYYLLFTLVQDLAAAAWVAILFLATSWRVSHRGGGLSPQDSGLSHWSRVYFALFGARVISRRFLLNSLFFYAVAIVAALLIWNAFEAPDLSSLWDSIQGETVTRFNPKGWEAVDWAAGVLAPQIPAAILLNALNHRLLRATPNGTPHRTWLVVIAMLVAAFAVWFLASVAVHLVQGYLWRTGDYIRHVKSAFLLTDGGGGYLSDGVALYAHLFLGAWCAFHATAIRILRASAPGLAGSLSVPAQAAPAIACTGAFAALVAVFAISLGGGAIPYLVRHTLPT